MSNDMLTRDAFIDFVKRAKIGAVATVTPEHRPEAALVELAVTEDGGLVFQSKAAARKVSNLFHQARVALVVGWGDMDGVSYQVEGLADLLMGEDLAKMTALYAEQHPERPPMSDDFALYRVNPEWVRFCQGRPGMPPFVVEGALA